MPLRILRCISVLVALVAWPAALSAAEPTFPAGSRIGLVPPAGMVPSRTFQGFEDAERKTAIVLAEFTVEAFADLEKQIFGDVLQQQGIAVDQRSMLPLATGIGFLISGRQDIAGVPHRKWFVVASDPEFTPFVTVQRPDDAASAYPDDVIRTALQSIAFRAVPRDELLAQFPFKIGELAGFPHVRTLVRGMALLLSDGTEGILERPAEPYLVLSMGAGPPPKPEDRNAFAQRLLGGIQGYRDVRITSADPMRIAGMAGYELRAEGRHEKTGTEIALVQWVRFGPGGFLRMVGIAQKSSWPQAFTRFRAVRDGIEPR
jgi:hypothetical protein